MIHRENEVLRLNFKRMETNKEGCTFTDISQNGIELKFEVCVNLVMYEANIDSDELATKLIFDFLTEKMEALGVKEKTSPMFFLAIDNL